jgi:hypothetical protein
MGSGARREIEIEISGKKYTVRELDLDAYGEIENFVKTKRARMYRESAAGMDPDRVDGKVMEIIKSNITPEELGEETSATDCVAFAAYLSMRHNPGITRENFGEVVGMDDIGRIGDIIDSMGEDGEAAGEDDENPPEAEAGSP